MRIETWLIVLAVGCGGNQRAGGPPAPAAEVAGNIVTAALPPDCPFRLGATWALETASGVRLPATGGKTDAASVVTIIAHASGSGAPSILYHPNPPSCATATFPSAAPMVATGSDPEGEGFSGIIPAFPSGTRVCWKLAVPVCGVTAAGAPAGLPSFDYTTVKAQ